MHIQEVSDEVAERLKLEESQRASQPEPQEQKSETVSSEKSQDATKSTPATAAIFPEISPGRAMTERKTVDEVVAELKATPFFMTELEENDETDAFKALSYEGTPLENALEFKEQGNEVYKIKRYADAKEFYTKGILILAKEERKRKQKAESSTPQPPAPEPRKEEDGEQSKKEETSEEEVLKERALLETLYGNRSACHLELKNYRSCWLDGSAALRLNPNNIKAYYRSARAFLAVDRIAEADDACARGLAIDESNKPLKAVARDIIKRAEETTARQKRDAETLAREKRRALLIKAALKARGIHTRTTPQPPEMEDAGIKLEPDPDDPTSYLVLPTVLLYPVHLESDFIKAFEETHTLADHLSYVFPLPWDQENAYTMNGVECYMETIKGGLIKIGKSLSLLKVLSSGKVEVVDEVVRIFILPIAKASDWVEEFKMKKAAEKGKA
ncbi:TPR-like protein [Astrocystis sublimbata]|nr:TPR-like protein [Astrocystis sublimbata]